VGITRARRELYLTSAMRRRIFGEYKDTEPSRFLDEVPPELQRHEESRAQSSMRAPARSWGYAATPYSRAPLRPPREVQPEDEDQSGRGGLRPGGRVRHAMFGVGTVQSVEELDDDVKVVVKFTTVGTKTLRAKYAKLQPA
jgi:DNA helicase-2/ATP-dependent DNA helicase PcrA